MRSLMIVTLVAMALYNPAASPGAEFVMHGVGDCDSGFDVDVNATVNQDKLGNVKVVWKGREFTPGQTLTCHVDCPFGGTPPAAQGCGTVDGQGKVTARAIFPPFTCLGMVPFITIDGTSITCSLGISD